MLQNSQVDEDDPVADLDVEEIKIQNKKLRTAITALNLGFEDERKRMEQQLKEETVKDRKIKELEFQLEKMDLLQEELSLKEQELGEMKEKLEDGN